MRSILFRTIYILFLPMYIFTGFVTPLSFDIALQNINSVKGSGVYTNIYEIGVREQSVTIDKIPEIEKFSIHQYDDNRYKSAKIALEGNSSILRNTSSELAAYSYHTNPLNSKEVLGFMPYWSLSSYQNIQYNRMSTLAYFSLTCDNTGAWITGYLADNDGDGDKEWTDDGGYVGFHSSNFTNMVSLAHAKGTKVVLLVKNFDPYSIRAIVRNIGGAGDALINNIKNAISTKSLDGVNIDFEYVPHKDADVVTDDLRADFAAWHDKLADAIHAQFPQSHVSTDTFGSAGVSYTIYDMTALGKTSLNYIVMMTYDYIITSCWNGKKIAPMSPLYGNNLYGTPNWNVASHTLAGGQKAGFSKVLMGIPYYGIDFQVQYASRNSYNAYVDYPTCDGTIETYGSVVDPAYDAYHNTSSIKWNDTEKATYYIYYFGGKWRHGYYDDARSLGAKYDYVNNTNLGGIAIWAMGYDRNADELYDVIREKFQIVPFYVMFENGTSSERISAILSAAGVSNTTDYGNGVIYVTPNAILSSTAMSRLKAYPEVVGTSFELLNQQRNISL